MNNEITQVSKTIEEVAKTAGKSIDAVKNFCAFISKYTGGSIREAAGIFEDKLRYARWKNQIKLMQKAEKFLKEMGLDKPNKTIQLKFAVPLLQAASLEEDEYLQDMWAKLLVTATTTQSNFEIKRMYIDILENLSSFDAQILEKIYSIPYEKALHKPIITSGLSKDIILPEKAPDKAPDPPDNDIKLSLLNLDRLNCVSIVKSMGGGQIFGLVNQTLLGKNFIDACSTRRDK
jgi:hypothetical protein